MIKIRLKAKKRLKNRSGSFLLEAILSVVILSVSITMIIQAMTASLRAASYSAEYTQALVLADEKIHELLNKRSIVSGYFDEGTFPAFDEKYQYLIESDSVNKDMNQVTLKLSWRSGRKNNAIVLDTYLFAE